VTGGVKAFLEDKIQEGKGRVRMGELSCRIGFDAIEFDHSVPDKTPILIAEDDENDSHLLQRAIKKAGVLNVIHIVTDGEQAIDFLDRADRQKTSMPAFLMIDVKMPRKNGFEVLEWRRKHPTFYVLPTVVWSSSRVLSDVERAYRLGANTYFVKPSRFDDLQDLVTSIFGYWARSEKSVHLVTKG
jgi:CheY-like chemotaxis protein